MSKTTIHFSKWKKGERSWGRPFRRLLRVLLEVGLPQLGAQDHAGLQVDAVEVELHEAPAPGTVPVQKLRLAKPSRRRQAGTRGRNGAGVVKTVRIGSQKGGTVGEFTTHFWALNFRGDWDVHWGYDPRQGKTGGCGSKTCTQNGGLWNQRLRRNCGYLILSHTQVCVAAKMAQIPSVQSS